MKPQSLSLLGTLAASAAAVDLLALQAQLPPCSLKCLLSGAQANGCAVTDYACQCSKLQDMLKTVSPCLVKANCDLSDISSTAKIVTQVCEAEGVTPAAAKASSANQTSTASSSQTAGTAFPWARSVFWLGVAAVAAAAAVL